MSREKMGSVSNDNNMRMELGLKISKLIADKLIDDGGGKTDSENVATFVFDSIVDGLEYRTDSEIQLMLTYLALNSKEDTQ